MTMHRSYKIRNLLFVYVVYMRIIKYMYSQLTESEINLIFIEVFDNF